MIPYGFGVWEIVIVIVVALVILACLIGAIFLIVWAFRRSGSTTVMPDSAASGARTPLQIAQERYARGEISREEYQQIVSDLQKLA